MISLQQMQSSEVEMTANSLKLSTGDKNVDLGTHRNYSLASLLYFSLYCFICCKKSLVASL